MYPKFTILSIETAVTNLSYQSEQPRSHSGGLCDLVHSAERVYRCHIRDINHLIERLIEWRRFDHNTCIIDRAVNQWRDRLHKCVRAKGGHFEHLIEHFDWSD